MQPFGSMVTLTVPGCLPVRPQPTRVRLKPQVGVSPTRRIPSCIDICIFSLRLLGRCERTPHLRFYLQLCLGLRSPSLPCLRACFFHRFPRGSHEPPSDGCSPVPSSRSLEPPTSAATPNLRDIFWEKETRTFYTLWSWKLSGCNSCCSAKNFFWQASS